MIIVLFSAISSAQEQRITLNEARLVEKHNQILRGLPKILLEAYCKGEIAAYYPNYPKAQVSFTEFLNYANMADPTYNQEGLMCPSEFCQLSKEDLLTFQNKMEFLEIEQRAQVGQEPSKLIYYIRLKVLNKGEFYNGPVFYTSDILALGDRYKLYNPKNDAAPLSIKKVLLARMFSSKTIKDFSNIHFDPDKPQLKKTDDDLYEY
jgi:hypothetical protein